MALGQELVEAQDEVLVSLEDGLYTLDDPLGVDPLRLELLHDFEELIVGVLLVLKSLLQLAQVRQRLLLAQRVVRRGLLHRGVGGTLHGSDPRCSFYTSGSGSRKKLCPLRLVGKRTACAHQNPLLSGARRTETLRHTPHVRSGRSLATLTLRRPKGGPLLPARQSRRKVPGTQGRRDGEEARDLAQPCVAVLIRCTERAPATD
mmetsp:Transcript_29551/g.73769  ORF Transcript_29551/g.73769 Transcript_29551/m.73769 type:complete len:204 (-) Transcript_29551:76-687(-)